MKMLVRLTSVMQNMQVPLAVAYETQSAQALTHKELFRAQQQESR